MSVSYKQQLLIFILSQFIYYAYLQSQKPTYYQETNAKPYYYTQNQLEYSDKETGKYNYETKVEILVYSYQQLKQVQSEEKQTEIINSCPKNFQGKKFIQIQFVYEKQYKDKIFTEEQFRPESDQEDSDLYLCFLKKGILCIDTEIRDHITVNISQEDQKFLDDYRKVDFINNLNNILFILYIAVKKKQYWWNEIQPKAFMIIPLFLQFFALCGGIFFYIDNRSMFELSQIQLTLYISLIVEIFLQIWACYLSVFNIYQEEDYYSKVQKIYPQPEATLK
ncbi:hypothetical protein PPERSA_10971 [Pseudocohnilembus persalinus]|uniref:Transmembrane protein n=1 Tax=Pseudocohnilembus persalinus TaxID=266149 RepID=A0A0V0QC76_PSEPJ|nr:hypothetical protein PPERSA_10971 [Pseudocohnilembus persalinus]|eukprot:KRW99852.1 hypothetical protein PPERSA_10971 [Pseudocohnilembus persalinus]